MTGWTIIGWVATAGSLVSLSGAVAWMRWRSRSHISTPGMGADSFALEDLGAESLGSTPNFSTPSFNMERYQPMERLLSSEDLQFIKQLPGYHPRIAAQWKRDQRRIFRLYLSELAGDFHRLHDAARLMVAESTVPSASIVSLLIGQKFAFWRAMAALELRLMLPGAVGSIHVRPLLQALEAMRLQVEHGMIEGSTA